MAKDDNGDNGDDDRDPFFDSDEEVIDEQDFDAEGWDEIPDDPEAASRIIEALGALVPNILKRGVEAGMGGISASEERIRKVLAERKMPKEVAAYLLKQVDNTKKEAIRVISGEVRDFLENADLGGELAKILTTLSLEAKIQVRFIENENASNKDSVKPKASGKMRVRQAKEEDSNESSDGSDDGDEGDDEN